MPFPLRRLRGVGAIEWLRLVVGQDMVSTLDTHELVKDLTASGFTEAQAEAVTRAVRLAQDIDLSELATKTDLGALHGDVAAVRSDMTVLRSDMAVLRSEMAALRSDVEAMIAAVELRLIKWVIGVGVAAVLALTGVIWTATQLILRALPHP